MMYILAITYCNIFWDILCKNVRVIFDKIKSHKNFHQK